ncbi:MAG: penicillin-binding protein 2 [Calditrichaeota bacterium]|nr:penicillin-binding protein 2 [Calditrichota bacterium]
MDGGSNDECGVKRPSHIWWSERRYLFYVVFIALLLVGIEIRLFQMQVVSRPDFLKQAAANRLRADVIEPPRGRIFDRNGALLVDNRPIYTVYALPWTIRRNPHTIELLSSDLGLEPAVLERRISQRGWTTFQPAPVMRDIPLHLLARLEANKIDLPGITFQSEAKRNYPIPGAAHFLGYVGERPPDAKKEKGRFGLIGRRGLEKTYEEWLGGTPGVRFLEVDSNGRILGVVEDPPPVAPQAGWDLILNIDAGLQQLAAELLTDKTGAVVALDPRNGEILTLLSLPDYDPALFAGVLPPEIWRALETDPEYPLLNRAIQGLYPPGSTFKMVTLAAGLEAGVVTPGFHTSCGGGMQIGNRYFKCWNKSGHGTLDWAGGLQKSCDVFFYTVGLRIGVDAISRSALQLALGSRTGIDLDGELKGLAPTSTYLSRRHGTSGWSKGLAANIAIGQGEVLATPLQLAVHTGAIATGVIARPHLGRDLVHPISGEIRPIDPVLRPVNISPMILARLREAMRMVVNEPGGTAGRQKRQDIVIAGKTGTAQNPHGKDHALFVGFAPFDDPVIACAVVVEHGEHGSSGAAPIACQLMEWHIHNLYPGPRPDKWVTAVPGTPSAPIDTLGQVLDTPSEPDDE